MSNPVKIVGALFVIIMVSYAIYALLANPTLANLRKNRAAIMMNETVPTTIRTLQEEATEYSIHIEYPEFGIPVIDTVVQDAMVESAGAFKEQAVHDTPVLRGLRQYELFGTVASTYAGPDVVSARIVLSQDFGGAHPLPVIVTFNFDRASGRALTLDDALAMTGLSLETLASGALSQLAGSLGEEVIFLQGAEGKVENYQTFVFDERTITFIFQPYQVAPYAAGAPEVSFVRVR